MKIFIVLLSLFLILFFPFWLVQFLMLLVLLVIALSFIYARLIYGSITVTHNQEVIRAYKLQKIDIDLFMENKSLIPIHYLSVWESPGELVPISENKFLFSLAKRQKVRLSYQLKGLSRGEYALGPIIIKASDPLGLFPWEKRIEEKCRVIIYPSLFKIKKQITSGYPGGNIRIRDKMYEDITRLKSIREYIPGDDIRHISWKVSARLGSLHTREFLPALQSPALLVLNLTLEDYPLKHRHAHLEKAIEIAASFVAYFLSLDQEIGLITSGLINNIQPQLHLGAGCEHTMLILENLAKIKGCPQKVDIIGILYNSGLCLPNGARIILISPLLSEKQLQAFASFRRRRGFLEYIPIAGKISGNINPKVTTYSLTALGGESLYA
jgi:uncharacterized protein (DUF58 family)